MIWRILLSAHHPSVHLACFAAFLYPGVVLAEVSDKIATTELLWKISLVTALLCFLGARVKPWLGMACFVPAAIWFITLFLEIHSPDIGPHLHLEQGPSYYLQAYAAFSLTACGLLAGCVWHRKHLT